MKSIKNLYIVVLLATLLVSCSQKETLQGYFVNHQDSPNFMSIDIPTGVLGIDKTKLTEEQKLAYESINKLNMLGYSLKDGNETEFQKELSTVRTILKDDKYQDLIRGGNNSDGKVVVKYIGTDSSIDELIVLGSMNDKGFAVVRVLGDDMQPAKILKLSEAIKDINVAEQDISSFVEFFK